jgi:hypothetical protein
MSTRMSIDPSIAQDRRDVITSPFLDLWRLPGPDPEFAKLPRVNAEIEFSLNESTTLITLAVFLMGIGTVTGDIAAAQSGQLSSSNLSKSQTMLSDPPKNCPISRPSLRPFVPPSPYPAKTSSANFWFGTVKLWTSLPADGTWRSLPHYTPGDPTFRQKLLF